MFTIYEKLGGKEAAFDIIAAARPNIINPRPTHHAEAVWRREGKLPGTIINILMEECERRGIPYSLADFRVQREGQAA